MDLGRQFAGNVNITPCSSGLKKRRIRTTTLHISSRYTLKVVSLFGGRVCGTCLEDDHLGLMRFFHLPYLAFENVPTQFPSTAAA